VTKSIDALSYSPAAERFVDESGPIRLLHAFTNACNLINAKDEILAVVSPGIGNGPFNLVVNQVDFLTQIPSDPQLSIDHGKLHLGRMIINTTTAQIWQPHPNWPALHRQKHILLSSCEIIEGILTSHAPPDSLANLTVAASPSNRLQSQIFTHARQAIALLSTGLPNNDPSSIKAGASRLAGLGPGLTPAGDDFLLGILLGLWALLPSNQAHTISGTILQAAAPRTSPLSTAWLKAAAAGEAGESWHHLFEAIINDDVGRLRGAVHRILPTGHTSGADALAGFVHLLSLEYP